MIIRRLIALAVVGAAAVFMVGSLSAAPVPIQTAPIGRMRAEVASAVSLDVAPGRPGGVAEARLSVAPVEGVRGFNLLLQFEPDLLLSATSADFQRSDPFFPVVRHGHVSETG